MKQQIIRIFVNALIGAVTSAASVWLGASAVEAVTTGSASSAALGNTATNIANNILDGVRAALA